jgi:hypothetical protein
MKLLRWGHVIEEDMLVKFLVTVYTYVILLYTLLGDDLFILILSDCSSSQSLGGCQVLSLDLIFFFYQSCRDLNSYMNNRLRSKGDVW